jgi:transposase
MSTDELNDLDPESIDDKLSFRELFIQLKGLVVTLNLLVTDLRKSLAEKDELLAEQADKIAELEKTILGPSSERTRRKKTQQPTPKGDELSAEEKKVQRKAARKKGKKNRDERAAMLEEKAVEHPAPDVCPSCDGDGPFRVLSPDISTEVEYLGEQLLRLMHRVEKKVCPCGHIFTGDGPERVTEGTHYGPALYANAIVSKCADAIPLNRMSKRFSRQGLHVARSTLTNLYHRGAELLEPIQKRLLEIVAASYYVNADETSQPVMDVGQCRRGFIWTFIANGIIGYIFSATRHGKTAKDFLEGTVGILQVDAYSGYNAVCIPEGRDRIGCISHCRRYFHKARDKCPELADHYIATILSLYKVEYDAAKRGILGTDAHKALRKLRSQVIMDEWKLSLEEKKEMHTPKSPMGKAIRYTLNQWETLIKFISDPKIRLDNNISEGALRIIALGRDNFRWVGHNQSGHNLAILQTVVATCVANGVNPQDYITDVLIRVQTHPAKDIDALLPMNWKPLAATVS